MIWYDAERATLITDEPLAVEHWTRPDAPTDGAGVPLPLLEPDTARKALVAHCQQLLQTTPPEASLPTLTVHKVLALLKGAGVRPRPAVRADAAREARKAR